MASAQITLLTAELPPNATSQQELAWIKRMRRVIDRWDKMPDSLLRPLSPKVRRKAYKKLDELEQMVWEDMLLFEEL